MVPRVALDRFGLILIDFNGHRVSEQNLDSTDSTLRDTFERSEVDFAFRTELTFCTDF